MVTPDQGFSDRVRHHLGECCTQSTESEFQPILRYEVKAPAVRSPLFVLLGHSGRVLARVRSEDDVLATLLAHLESITTPLDAGNVRFHLQATASPFGVTLVDKRLTAGDQPFVERRLERLGAAVIDSPFIDVSADHRVVARAARPEWALATDGQHVDPSGHRSCIDLDDAITSVALWGDPDAAMPQALVCAVLARSAEGGHRALVLDRSALLARSIEVVLGPHGSVHRLLRDLQHQRA